MTYSLFGIKNLSWIRSYFLKADPLISIVPYFTSILSNSGQLNQVPVTCVYCLHPHY